MGSTVYAKFVPVEHEDITSIGIKFRVVSYNILAQSLAKSRIFPHSPSPCLRARTELKGPWTSIFLELLEWATVKLAQAKYFLSRVARFKKMVSEKFKCTPSVLIAGDFNSVPESQVYQYLVSGGPMADPSAECSENLPMPLCKSLELVSDYDRLESVSEFEIMSFG
nr:hypothetical protein [Tanacetum cinerariifolium]